MGQSVYRLDGRLAELESHLPWFAQVDCTYENALNEYLDLIVREPERDDDRRVPVATVSKRYALIQHGEVVSWLCSAFEAHEWYSEVFLGWPATNIRAYFDNVRLTTHEREGSNGH